MDEKQEMCYEAERDAEMSAMMDNLTGQAVNEIIELKKALNKIDEQALRDLDQEIIGETVARIYLTNVGLIKIASVMGFLDAAMESYDCPQLRAIDDTQIREFMPQKREGKE